MNKKILIGLSVLLTVIMAFSPFAARAGAESASAALAPTSKAAILFDAQTGTVVFEKNTEEHLPIASMVKIMTLDIAFDEIQKRGIPYDTMITVSDNAASMGGSQAFLDANKQYRLDELIKSVIVASANDSCVAIAEYLYGSVDAFVARMNDRAKELGMNDTAFTNCTGLPKDGQYCCAKDVAAMFSDLIKHEKFFEYSKVWMYDFEHPDGRVTSLTNTNKLVRFYNGCDGGKTGYTDAARSCIAVTAKRGDTRLICVSVGAENSKARNKEVSEMLNYGFANYKTVYAAHAGDIVCDVEVENGKTPSIRAAVKDDFTVFTKAGEECELTLQPNIGAVKAPVAVGDVIGSVDIIRGGEKIGEAEVIAADACEKKGYLDIVDDFIENW